MATLILSAVGSAVGSAIGGSVLGLSSALIGRAIGASIGQSIDRAWFGQKVMGSGSDIVEYGRLDRLRLSAASEGAGIEDVYGRMRLGGQIIWSSRFREHVTSEDIETGGGGKGGGGGGETSTTTIRNYSYTISLAVALCEGEICRLGRIWADGNEIAPKTLNIRVYKGTEDQLPDPKIEAVQGAGKAPAYRGMAYVVIEDLELAAYGNRVPQFSFEVIRPEPEPADPETDLSRLIRGVALVPGTGEYTLARDKVYIDKGKGKLRPANVSSPARITDILASVRALRHEVPNFGATSLVVSWFGNDLRCGNCSVAPRVEQKSADAEEMPWTVSGLSRASAAMVPYQNNRPVYGGTPTDQSVRQAIEVLKVDGRAVMFYPFVLMEQLDGNGLPDPWSDAADQPPLPWRGRITLSNAPGRPGSPDGTPAAAAEVATFFGTAGPGDFALSGGERIYTGPAEFSYRRFILHYAWLCKDAGGVDGFCIGSELRGLTRIRGAGNSFPAVAELRALAADVRTILGSATKIGYAADWSEYFGYHPNDGSGDVFFHLDPLWADPAIDFVGIDNYMPLSDWRDGDDHADADFGDIYNLEYLRANIEGGEGYDWYYAGPEGKAAQNRLPIADSAHGEDWVFRYKDLRSWWSNPHHDRPGGVRSAVPTAWVPGSKPIWFTEIGCPAVDKGTNAPNLFYDPKSSESNLPPYSNGRRDDFIQMQYLTAQITYWNDSANNPVSGVSGEPMVDMSRCFVWAWDARPFPSFPNRRKLWSDGPNYERGHWLNGRVTARSLASVVREICARSGVTDIDVSRLYGVVRGFQPGAGMTGRAALQPLMLAYGFDAIERDGVLVFRNRNGRATGRVDDADLIETDELRSGLERSRAPDVEGVGRVQVSAIETERNFQIRATEAVFPGDQDGVATGLELPLLLTRAETRDIAERWLAEARVSRDRIRFALPPSRDDLRAGDLVEIDEAGGRTLYRIDQLEQAGARIAEGVRVEPSAYVGASDSIVEDDEGEPDFVEPAPVFPTFLDLPVLTGAEVPHAPHVAVFADPWPGPVAVYRSATSDGFQLSAMVESAAVVGETVTALDAARPGLIDRGPALTVSLFGGVLSSVSEAELHNGANFAAIGSGLDDTWELFQFADAVLVDTDTYEISRRLRGQAGTDALMPASWPAGSRFVLLNTALRQVSLGLAERGLARNWRIGPGSEPVSDPVYLEEARTFEGLGLRPFAPVHLRASPDGAGGHLFSWIRRTRIEGDSWSGLDVPIGEDREAYFLRVSSGGTTVRESIVTSPSWVYSAAERAADGVAGPFTLEIAQLSDRFGPGLFRRIDIDE